MPRQLERDLLRAEAMPGPSLGAELKQAQAVQLRACFEATLLKLSPLAVLSQQHGTEPQSY